MINGDQIKKWYVELRYGSAIATPLFSYSSFVLIAYNFTGLSIVPFPIFAVLFSIGLIAGFITIGSLFRQKQMSTDQDILYQQQRDSARTQKIILEAIHEMMESSSKKLDVYERIQYLKQIEQNGKKSKT